MSSVEIPSTPIISSASSDEGKVSAAKVVSDSASLVIDVPTRTTSLSGAIFNLTKSAVGAGTVYLPSIFYLLGPTTAGILLISGAFVCSLSLYFLGRLAHHCSTGDYFKLGRLALGKQGERAVSVSLLLFLLGGLIAYANLTGSFVSGAVATLSKANKDTMFLTPGTVTVLSAIFVIFPLSCLRDMSALAKTSIVGMLSMLYISGLLAYDAFTVGTTWAVPSTLVAGTDKLNMSAFKFASALLESVGKLIFAFVNHFTIVSLVPVMKDPSASARAKLISVSTACAVLIYSMAAFGGLGRFGSLAYQQNALGVFENAKAPVPLPYTIAQILLGFVLMCSFPLLCDPARSCLDSLVFGPASSVSPVARHYLETGIIVAVPTAVAYFVQDKADDFLSLFSGFCGSLLVFAFPGIFFLILSPKFKFSMSQKEKLAAQFCVALGVILAILSTIVNIRKLLGV